jgi:hypothetical protein
VEYLKEHLPSSDDKRWAAKPENRRNSGAGRFVLLSVMRYHQLLGIASLSGGSLLLGALLYDPSDIVAAFGLQQRMSEANVAILGLLFAATCIAAGFAALRSQLRYH